MCIRDRNEDSAEEEKKDKTIYYVTDEKQQSQYINMFKAAKLDAVMLTDRIDQPFISQLEAKNEGIHFARIDADLTDAFKAKTSKKTQEELNAQAEKVEKLVQKALKNDKIKVKIEKLKNLSLIHIYLTNMQNQYESVYGSQIWNASDGQLSLEQEEREQVLTQLARIKVMNLLAQKKDVTLDDKEKERAAAAGREYFTSLNSAEVTALNVTQDLITKMYEEYALCLVYTSRGSVIRIKKRSSTWKYQY